MKKVPKIDKWGWAVLSPAEKEANTKARLEEERAKAAVPEKPKPKKRGPKPKKANYHKSRAGIVYVARFNGKWRIGKTQRFQRREQELMKQFGVEEVYVHRLIATHDIDYLQRVLYTRFALKRRQDDYFDLDGDDLFEITGF